MFTASWFSVIDKLNLAELQAVALSEASEDNGGKAHVEMRKCRGVFGPLFLLRRSHDSAADD